MVFVTELQYTGIGFRETGFGFGIGFGLAPLFKPVSAFFSASASAFSPASSASDTSLSRTNFQTQKPRAPLRAATGAASDISISNTRPSRPATSIPSRAASLPKSESTQNRSQRFSKHFAKPYTGGHRGSGTTIVVKRSNLDQNQNQKQTQSMSGNPIQ
jgi:hypothetical protein